MKAKPQTKPTDNTNAQRSRVGYVLGGMSFIPLFGVPLGIAAIAIGITKKMKGPVLLGVAGILATVILYGGLFYFGFVSTTGPFAELKKQLASQTLNDTGTRILAYKATHNTLPANLHDLGQPSPKNPVFTSDPWGQPLRYEPHPDGTFILTSNGPDKIFGTLDDITFSQ